MGRLRSQTFVLGGDGQIDFLLSGGNDIDNLYFALMRAADDTILFKTTSYEYPEYVRHEWDASAYPGCEYVKLVDTKTGGWGHISLDDVNVPIVAPPIAPSTHGGDEALVQHGESLPAVL